MVNLAKISNNDKKPLNSILNFLSRFETLPMVDLAKIDKKSAKFDF